VDKKARPVRGPKDKGSNGARLLN